MLAFNVEYQCEVVNHVSFFGGAPSWVAMGVCLKTCCSSYISKIGNDHRML